MPLNLITDRWIPVQRSDNGPPVIRPDEIAEPGVVFPDWPRADLNIACLELLIGLIFLADPPANDVEWRARRTPDPRRLREKLEPLSPAFNLTGERPLFLQDFETLEGEPNPPEMLFIDSAGGNTAKNNADLMVRRNRYPALDLNLAAMALYTLQAHAPSGGAGNRTSMRGGGPMVTLVDPGAGRLWDLVWANVPNGKPAGLTILPWMKPTRISEAKGSEIHPPQAHPAEAFFGMPRRLRLVTEEDRVTGVTQRPYGTNYAGWIHPLTPYYRLKEGGELLPTHPRPGLFGYRNWLGVMVEAGNLKKPELGECATIVKEYQERLLWTERQKSSVIVAGWAMDNMKPRDFIFSRQRLPPLAPDSEEMTTLKAMIQTAKSFASDVLRPALKNVAGSGEALNAACESFFIETQTAFHAGVDALARGAAPVRVAEEWVCAMEKTAMAIFDREAMLELWRKDLKKVETITKERDKMRANFAGWRKPGVTLYSWLDLSPRQKKEAA